MSARRLLLAAVTLSASAALADPPSVPVNSASPAELEQMIGVLRAQRNYAEDQAASLAAHLGVVQKELDALKAAHAPPAAAPSSADSAPAPDAPK